MTAKSVRLGGAISEAGMVILRGETGAEKVGLNPGGASANRAAAETPLCNSG